MSSCWRLLGLELQLLQHAWGVLPKLVSTWDIIQGQYRQGGAAN